MTILSLTWESPYLGKTVFILRQGPGVFPEFHVWSINSLRPRHYGHQFTDDIFKCISLNENVWILLQILLKLVPEVQIDNIPALVSIMAWCRPGDKPLSEPMMASLLTHICVATVLLLCHTLATRTNGKVLIIWNISHSKNFFHFYLNSWSFVPRAPIKNKHMVQVMAWRWTGLWQSIIRTNFDPVHWHIYALSGLNELIASQLNYVNVILIQTA